GTRRQRKLRGGVRLTGTQVVADRDCPTAGNMTDDAMLAAVEGKLFGQEQVELVREVETGKSVLRAGEVERVLRKGNGRAGAEGAEDFVGVVGGLAVGVVGTH